MGLRQGENRTSSNLDGAITDYTYQLGTNKLSQTSGADPASYTYDATGRMTDWDGTDLIWDESGRLTSAEINGQSQGAYDYDNQNRRVIRTAGGETLHTLYDQAGNVLTEINDQGELLREFAYLDGVRTALFDYTGTTPATYYYLSDHLNTAQLLTDASGLVAWQGNYTPFGDVEMVINTVENNFRFPGQVYDAETGLYYNWNRFYDPATGRYLSADPIGLEGGINMFAYVGGDPVNGVDPKGLAKMCCRLLNSVVVGSVLRKRHCYIVADDGTVYGLYPKDKKGVPRVNDPRDKGGKCSKCPSNCKNQDQCLKEAHDGYPTGNYYKMGPNSNTYAGTLARKCCKGGVPSGLGNAPGINDNPPSLSPSPPDVNPAP